ncbi:P-II family nitrogen regulator [Desemzia sp. FAM 23991]|uniref:P-II family nitrogen regulator n=1 Tax=unclassified Desemzia TaxID=2685243 RepID=UPI003886B47B
MTENPSVKENIDLLFFIVNDGMGSDVIRIAKKNGSSGGTVFYGYGTINNLRLKMLGLDNIRKEVVLMLTEESKSESIMKVLTDKLKLERPNRGIAFAISLLNILGRRNSTYDQNAQIREDDSVMHQAIFVIVERGQAEEVIDAAVAAGSQGGTVISARGSGVHETSRLFGMDIEPEKEIVLILSENDKVDPIVASISNATEIEKPGQGILFTVDVKDTKGLF